MRLVHGYGVRVGCCGSLHTITALQGIIENDRLKDYFCLNSLYKFCSGVEGTQTS
jgi:hypothetical protein